MKKLILTCVASMLMQVSFAQVSLEDVSDAIDKLSGVDPAADYTSLTAQAKQTYQDRIKLFSSLADFKSNEEYLFSYAPESRCVVVLWLGKDKKLQRNIVLLDDKCANCKAISKSAISYDQWQEKLKMEKMMLPDYFNSYVRKYVLYSAEAKVPIGVPMSQLQQDSIAAVKLNQQKSK